MEEPVILARAECTTFLTVSAASVTDMLTHVKIRLETVSTVKIILLVLDVISA